MSFADRLKSLRTGRGLSQSQLADQTGLRQRSISHWESGKVEPGWSAVLALADFFGVTLDEFRGGSGGGRATTGRAALAA